MKELGVEFLGYGEPLEGKKESQRRQVWIG
jgi:hypothetical protein